MTSHDRSVRTRFAPSPTGYPHIGNIRTALYAWLLAQQNGGQFLLRIEDTDRSRFVEGAEENIMSVLRQLGLNWDEGPDVGGAFGPYRQSERLGIYQDVLDKLLDDKRAYPCFCPKTEDGEKLQCHCGDIPQEEWMERAKNIDVPWRFRMPSGEVVCNDASAGTTTFLGHTVNDPVLIKSDGYPTYHLASVVDDHFMEITHVLRGQEWRPTWPIHVALYEALGWQQPIWVHLPAVLGADGKKLSKRNGDAAVADFFEKGYLADALVNYLALVGWNPGDDREIMTRDELIQAFSIDRISLSGGIFDIKKLDHFNKHYIQNVINETRFGWELAERDLLKEEWKWDAAQRTFDYVRMLDLIQKRVGSFGDAVPLLEPFFERPTQYEKVSDLSPKGSTFTDDYPIAVLSEVKIKYEIRRDPFWKADLIQERLREIASELPALSKVKFRDLCAMLRMAITGKTVSVPLFELMEILGYDECVERITSAQRLFVSK